MHAAAEGNSTISIPRSVGQEYSEADPGGKLPAKKDAEETKWKVRLYEAKDVGGVGVWNYARVTAASREEAIQKAVKENPGYRAGYTVRDDSDRLDACQAALDELKGRMDVLTRNDEETKFEVSLRTKTGLRADRLVYAQSQSQAIEYAKEDATEAAMGGSNARVNVVPSDWQLVSIRQK